MKNRDRLFIQRCFELALRGSGFVSPNPLVGAVIVKNENVISEGWHEKFGQPHAEANAIAKASESLEGATIYCNLEPCCHTNKKTPPCAQAIIKNGIKKVVVANVDPNPNVAGKGLSLLSENGIEVISGIEEEKGEYLNRFFFKHIRTKLPYVTVKIARSKDGMITGEIGKQTWITGKEAGVLVHQLRSNHDAVMVGANTVNIDDPELTVRYVEGRDPKRVIVDGKLSVNPKAKLFFADSPETILFTSAKEDNTKEELFLRNNIVIERVNSISPKIDMAEVLKRLGKMNINSLLVEGGATLFNQFVLNNLADEIVIIEAEKELGAGLKALSADIPDEYEIVESGNVGKDSLYIYRKRV